MFNNEPKNYNHANELFKTNQNVFTHVILSYEEPGMHGHDYIEFFYVIEGRCQHLLNGTSKPISSGDLFLLTTNDVHNFKKINDNYVHRDIAFTVDFFRKICNSYSESLYDKILQNGFIKQTHLSGEQINELETLVQPFMFTDFNKKNFLDEICESAVCTYLINTFLKQNLISVSAFPSWLSRMLALLSAPENFTVPQQTIVSFFPYSKEYICRAFKKAVGKTITDYFNEQKMNYAYSLLLSTSYSIEQICSLININSIPYFYRTFKKQFGMPPREVIK